MTFAVRTISLVALVRVAKAVDKASLAACEGPGSQSGSESLVGRASCLLLDVQHSIWNF
jgi:hypothetical protein